MKKVTREELAEAIKETQSACDWMLDGLPDKSNNKAQKILQKKHGTPLEFGRAVIAAIGEISILEAQQAIAKYKQEWELAK